MSREVMQARPCPGRWTGNEVRGIYHTSSLAARHLHLHSRLIVYISTRNMSDMAFVDCENDVTELFACLKPDEQACAVSRVCEDQHETSYLLTCRQLGIQFTAQGHQWRHTESCHSVVRSPLEEAQLAAGLRTG